MNKTHSKLSLTHCKYCTYSTKKQYFWHCTKKEIAGEVYPDAMELKCDYFQRRHELDDILGLYRE